MDVLVRIAVPKETAAGELRAALLPANVQRLVEKGVELQVETGLGATIDVGDDQYKQAGAEVVTGRQALMAGADIVLRVGHPTDEEIGWMQKDTIHVSFLDPFTETDVIRKLAAQSVRTISMEMLPRTTRAQKMDAISSQSNLAGYVTVIVAAERLDRVFPMMMTPAGTITPSRVFVIGAGVAGLQAIATAKRLGARVEAMDTRPEAAEQIESLNAKVVRIDLGKTESTKDGYAKALTDEQLELQRQGIAKVCANSDVVITTAKVFGRKAPVILTRDMVAGMRPGSVIVDMAVETGGNVEGSRLNEEVNFNGVRIVGLGNLPSRVAYHASQMYSGNLYAMIDEFWDEEAKTFNLDLEDEIVQGCLITNAGQVVNERVKAVLEGTS
ncbi:MAG TPA: NAD(P)(+) transhydrogenase (Re/Si-specific) subunit alpha [Lentisphaeria bacterium]|nr:NAD(P)(+) transhydrogenase (Re/Si-specific) subunit alpha [Lentisphaeria bacterium]|tara:strand:- start:150 stop:1304 length:1155 start_codon:yes stop_codon:yes gene_type:complete